jgi:hypothetical protein
MYKGDELKIPVRRPRRVRRVSGLSEVMAEYVEWRDAMRVAVDERVAAHHARFVARFLGGAR